MPPPDSPKPTIAASAHLVSDRAPDLSAVEFGLMIASHAFNRWIVRCMAAAGLPDLTAIDVIVLHHVHHRQRGKKLADICFTLNIEDTHIVNYSLKKLERLGVVQGQRSGKEVVYSVTAKGSEIISRYVQVRERCLIDGLPAASNGLEFSQELANLLRGLSGVYDQAARAATSL
ncbi:transcriptional regulator [Bordetella genomosp. 9]|uniref:winged helix DNA-binding protein n=1 Tax=Bordetella genomosp. 9 TaxID=1416803 RepID=UPI000A2917E1|nr:winged helix DNA-binding protein [Bordetella genomosp. 9]ARP90532.1 transcriptional regulator [Bordetella genomosp. 9]